MQFHETFYGISYSVKPSMINVQKLKRSDNLCWFRIHDLNSENPFPFSLGKIFPACFAFNIKLQNQISDPKWLLYCQKWPLEIPYPAQISGLLSRLTQSSQINLQSRLSPKFEILLKQVVLSEADNQAYFNIKFWFIEISLICTYSNAEVDKI